MDNLGRQKPPQFAERGFFDLRDVPVTRVTGRCDFGMGESLTGRPVCTQVP